MKARPSMDAPSWLVVDVPGHEPRTLDVVVNEKLYEKCNGIKLALGWGENEVAVPAVSGPAPQEVTVTGTYDNPTVWTPV